MPRSMGDYAISLIRRTILKYAQGNVHEIIPTLENFVNQERLGRASEKEETAPSAIHNIDYTAALMEELLLIFIEVGCEDVTEEFLNKIATRLNAAVNKQHCA